MVANKKSKNLNNGLPGVPFLCSFKSMEKYCIRELDVVKLLQNDFGIIYYRSNTSITLLTTQQEDHGGSYFIFPGYDEINSLVSKYSLTTFSN